MKHLVILVVMCTCCLFGYGQQMVQYDSAKTENRVFSNKALEAFKQDSDFSYNLSTEPPVSWWQRSWDRFWQWVWYNIGQLLSTKTGRATAWGVGIVLGVAVIAFFIFKVTGMNRGGLFGRSNSAPLNYTVGGDDINTIDFDGAIATAISEGNYRLATRLRYLQVLKLLSDKEYINWKINKTNTDYLVEMTGKPMFNTFSLITRNFDYTWYGERQVSKAQFADINEQFQQFNNQLK